MDSVFSVVGSFVDWNVRSLLLFAAVFILTADYIKNRRPKSFPPGPRAFPIVGNIFTLDYKRGHESMTQLAGKYGDVYSLRMGQAWMVVLNGFEILKEALVNQGDSLADRPYLPLQEDMFHGRGVISSNGNSWRQQRRFALSTLKYFGFGKKSLEPVILDEFTYCAKYLISYKGKPFNPHTILNNAVSNIICSLVFGHRFEHCDEKFIKLMKRFNKGLETEASIWGQVQAEIDRVIGQSRQPSMEDRVNLPYTDAVLHEVQRMGNIFPLSVPHATTRDIQLGGYTIPKGVTIIPNLTSVLFDKNEWKTPNTFNPGHFLNEEGKFVKRAAFIPFSAGKRVCLGENLARMELFLFFTSFMQHFTFSMPAGVKPVMDYCFGVTLAPRQYEICATSR